MGCGASTVAPVIFTEDPREKARRERQEEARRIAEKIANRRRITFSEKQHLDSTPGAWSDLRVFNVHFDDFVEHYRSKYTVFCLQDLKAIVDDCYERFLTTLADHVRETSLRYKHEKPSVIREFITAIFPQYFPGKERIDTVNLVANYLMVQMGKDGYITKHQFETLWERHFTQLFDPIITDARARKTLIQTIARCPAAPQMPKHIKVARSLENDTGNDSSLPLTAEETAMLKKKPYRWTDPAMFIPHMEQFWQHYAKDRRAPSMPATTLAVVAQDIVTNIQASVRQRMRTNYPSLNGAEYDKRFNAYLRRVLPVPFQYTFHARPVTDPLVLHDVVTRVQTYLTYHLDYERAGVVTKDAMLRYFAPCYLRAFDFDQKYSHAHLHAKLDPALVALANNTLFTTGALPSKTGAQPQSTTAPLPLPVTEPHETDALFPHHSPYHKPSDSLRIDLDTLPELPASRAPRIGSPSLLSMRSGSPPIVRPGSLGRLGSPSPDPLATPRTPRGGLASHRSAGASGASVAFDPRPSPTRRFSSDSNGTDSFRLPPIHGDHATGTRTLKKYETRTRIGSGGPPVTTIVADEDVVTFVPRNNKVTGTFTSKMGPRKGALAPSRMGSPDPVGSGAALLDTTDKAAIRALLTAAPSNTTSTMSFSISASPSPPPHAHAQGLTSVRKSSLPELVALRSFQADQELPEDVTARLPSLTLHQLPLLKVWPLALSSTVMTSTSTSAMGPEDVAQPRTNARRLSVWGADISDEVLLPLDAEDEEDIDRERLRRLTLYAASCATLEGVSTAPALLNYKGSRKADSLGAPGMGEQGRSPGASYERGSLRVLASRRGSPMPHEWGKLKDAKDDEFDDLPSDVDSDEEAASAPPKIDLKALSVLPVVHRGISVQMVSVVDSEQLESDGEEEGKASEQSSEAEGVRSTGVRSFRKLSMIDMTPEQVAALSAEASRPSTAAPAEPEEDEKEESPVHDVISRPMLRELEAPLVQDSVYSSDSGDLAAEVATTIAVLQFVESSTIPDAATLNRPPFARIHPLLKALQQLSGDKLFTGSLRDDILPTDTAQLLGKTPESKELRVRVGQQWVELVLYVADMFLRTLKHAQGGIIHNTGVPGFDVVYVSDAELFIACVGPLRGDAVKISNNIMVGKGVEVTNRLLQATALAAYLASR